MSKLLGESILYKNYLFLDCLVRQVQGVACCMLSPKILGRNLGKIWVQITLALAALNLGDVNVSDFLQC